MHPCSHARAHSSRLLARPFVLCTSICVHSRMCLSVHSLKLFLAAQYKVHTHACPSICHILLGRCPLCFCQATVSVSPSPRPLLHRMDLFESRKKKNQLAVFSGRQYRLILIPRSTICFDSTICYPTHTLFNFNSTHCPFLTDPPPPPGTPSPPSGLIRRSPPSRVDFSTYKL